MWRIGLSLLLLLGGFSVSNAEEKINLRVLYLGNRSSTRGKDYAAFLEKHFRTVKFAARQGFVPGTAAGYDVVVLDWSYSDREESKTSPLGPLDKWSTPTVFLGSAGLLMAERWDVHGRLG
jgi:hypothetical protein